jgi:hypothetical protein
MVTRIAIAFAFRLLWAVIWGSTASWAGIAAQYPGDVGIENDPNVLFVEKFDDSLSNVISRWTDSNNPGSMSLDTDVPPGSPSGSKSLRITNTGDLYKNLASIGKAQNDTMYVRYYIKYPLNPTGTHSGIWMGGYNPPLDYAFPRAGTKPVGNDRFIAGAEDLIYNSHEFSMYDYWVQMHRDLDGNYWGNSILSNPSVTTKQNQWMCVEHMVKLNNPVSAYNGEHTIWMDDVQAIHLGQGFPRGYWNGSYFIQNPSASTTFEGFQWRTDSALNLNWIWLQNYTPNNPSMTLKFDHVVVAKSYIGCLANGMPADTMPPAPPSNLTVR